jgi:hypothetical protein
MAQKKTNLNIPADLADQMNKDAREQFKKQNSKGGFSIPIPGGRSIDPSAFYLDHGFRPEKADTLFGDITQYLKNPDPACKYAWKATDPLRRVELAAGVRAGKYRTVEMDELKLDNDLRVEAGSMNKIMRMNRPEDTSTVQILDLVLVEVQPDAVNQQYYQREREAALRVSPNHIRSQFMNSGDKLMKAFVENEMIDVGGEEKQVTLQQVLRG